VAWHACYKLVNWCILCKLQLVGEYNLVIYGNIPKILHDLSPIVNHIISWDPNLMQRPSFKDITRKQLPNYESLDDFVRLDGGVWIYKIFIVVSRIPYPKVKFSTLVPNNKYIWNTPFWQMLYSVNILQYSLFHLIKNKFSKKLISLKFWHLFFKLFLAKPDLEVQ
jgi:hypothetical protein